MMNDVVLDRVSTIRQVQIRKQITRLQEDHPEIATDLGNIAVEILNESWVDELVSSVMRTEGLSFGVVTIPIAISVHDQSEEHSEFMSLLNEYIGWVTGGNGYLDLYEPTMGLNMFYKIKWQRP